MTMQATAVVPSLGSHPSIDRRNCPTQRRNNVVVVIIIIITIIIITSTTSTATTTTIIITIPLLSFLLLYPS
jgi:hypothetical protein